MNIKNHGIIISFSVPVGESKRKLERSYHQVTSMLQLFCGHLNGLRSFVPSVVDNQRCWTYGPREVFKTKVSHF